MEMWWGEIFGPTIADDISITFGPVKICVGDFDWLTSRIAASLSYNHCLGHVIRNPANVITFGQCNGSNIITFECNYINLSGFVGRNFANVITFDQM